MKILMAGGGTGGHFYPAVAIARAAEEKYNAEIGYIGRINSLESEKISRFGWPFFGIDIRGFQRGFSAGNLAFPFKLVKSLIASNKIIRDFSPDVVIGTGGYVSGPPVYMAARRGVFTAIQEQNSLPGVTSKILGKRVNAIYTGFRETEKYFSGLNVIFSGNPVRKEIGITAREDARKKFGIPSDKKVMLVFGGSQGSASINRNLDRIIGELLGLDDLFIIWQTGKAEFRHYEIQYENEHRLLLMPYIEDMDMAYAASDWGLTRAGALTLAELAVVGLPVILVPFPHAAEDHQMHNARAMEKEGAAIVIKDTDEYSAELLKNIINLYEEVELREKMSESIKRFAIDDAAERIIESVYNLWMERR